MIFLWGLAILLCFGRCASLKPIQNARGDICFSPTESCDEKLIRFIRSAEKSLDVAVFDVTHPQIVHEILVATKKIPVRILVDKRQSLGEHSLVSLLVRAGAQVKVGHQRGIMHHKFVVLDQKAVETGSFNFTINASFKNQENQVYLSDPVFVKRFLRQFEIMWSEGRAL
ncbi:MAG: phospholipase D-like domain-containing protein [Pseudomonadota bacterium]